MRKAASRDVGYDNSCYGTQIRDVTNRSTQTPNDAVKPTTSQKSIRRSLYNEEQDMVNQEEDRISSDVDIGTLPEIRNLNTRYVFSTF